MEKNCHNIHRVRQHSFYLMANQIHKNIKLGGGAGKKVVVVVLNPLQVKM